MRWFLKQSSVGERPLGWKLRDPRLVINMLYDFIPQANLCISAFLLFFFLLNGDSVCHYLFSFSDKEMVSS